jgi:hypothetical protein
VTDEQGRAFCIDCNSYFTPTQNADYVSHVVEVIAQTVMGQTRSDVGAITLAVQVQQVLERAGLLRQFDGGGADA